MAAPSHEFRMPVDRLVSVALFGYWQYQDEGLDASESSMSCCEDKLPSNAVYCTYNFQYVLFRFVSRLGYHSVTLQGGSTNNNSIHS